MQIASPFHDRDRLNREKYGQHAPLSCERIWIKPTEVTAYMRIPAAVGGARRVRAESGTVVESEFPPLGGFVMPLTWVGRIASCIHRWMKGGEWEDTAMYQRAFKYLHETKSIGGGLNIPEAALRICQKYDRMYLTVDRERRLRTREELNPGNFREEGGMVIHVGPGGTLFLGSGNRRFSISLTAGLEIVPAMVGYVHVSALRHLAALRQPPDGARAARAEIGVTPQD